MQRADKLFYLVPNPAAAVWIQSLNSSAETLEDSYAEGKPRIQTYDEITNRILVAVRAGLRVCAAFYGHPGVFVRSSHDAIRVAREEGFAARMLPGISAEDCLFADLGVNSGPHGWQCFEASDFLGLRRRFDPSSALILWQVGLLGEKSVRKGMSCDVERLQVLTDLLRRHYPKNHQVVLYEATQFPVCDPIIRRTSLARLPRERVEPAATLYLPPRPSRKLGKVVARWLSQ